MTIVLMILICYHDSIIIKVYYMNPTTTGLNGFHVHESGNFIWSGALSLAWRKLKSEIIQDEI